MVFEKKIVSESNYIGRICLEFSVFFKNKYVADMWYRINRADNMGAGGIVFDDLDLTLYYHNGRMQNATYGDKFIERKRSIEDLEYCLRDFYSDPSNIKQRICEVKDFISQDTDLERLKFVYEEFMNFK